jgi:hypothetical protein
MTTPKIAHVRAFTVGCGGGADYHDQRLPLDRRPSPDADDVVELGIEGLGSQRQYVVAPR